MHVREDRADIAPAFQNTDGLVRIRGRKDVKSSLFHHIHGARAEETFIFDHEHNRSFTGYSVHFCVCPHVVHKLPC
jgi:hypothetical protein